MGVRVLADENIKFTILTTAPADPAAPTASELNAGIDASCLVTREGFSWTATDSERINEDALCSGNSSESPGKGNYNLDFTPWRYFDPETGAIDAAADTLFEAVKEKGTELYGYVRRTGKEHSEDWASADEIQLGGSFVVDTPQVPDNTGFIKYRVPAMAQRMHDFIEVAAA